MAKNYKRKLSLETMSLYEPMDTDHRQTLLGLNQDNELERIISDVMNHKVSPNALAESRKLVKLGNALECLKDTLRSTSRTAKLWLRFMDYIEIIKDFICCERLGMWDGHLNAVTALLNLFAATCHIQYAKSARLYVQEMYKLPSSRTWLHQKFVEGYYTVRRSERLWAGLWTDVVIEQVLMRSLKSRGGLTRSRGMTESVRQQWVYSMYACAAIRDAMPSLTGSITLPVISIVEFGEARRQHDLRDMNTFLDWFRSHDPFDGNVPQHRSLASGLASNEGDGIDCDETEKVGSEIQRSLDSVSVRNATIKRRQMGHTLNELKSGVKVPRWISHCTDRPFDPVPAL